MYEEYEELDSLNSPTACVF